MNAKKIFFTFLFILYLTSTVFSQPLSPKTKSLYEKVTALTYTNKYDSAQSVALDFIGQKDLSKLESFYGHFMLGDILKSSGQTNKAIKILLASRTFLDNLPDKPLYESLVYGNVAECYFNSKEYKNAKEYSLLSLKTKPDSSVRSGGHAVNYMILGYHDYLEKKYSSAMDYYNTAIKEYTSLGERC